MAKMRVHELAKELGIENKQIIEFLSTTEHAVKSHSSSIEDDVQKMVRDKFQRQHQRRRQLRKRKQHRRQRLHRRRKQHRRLLRTWRADRSVQRRSPALPRYSIRSTASREADAARRETVTAVR